MIVSLEPDVAEYRRRSDGGYDVIEFPQWILMVDGVQWGYVSKKDGSPIHLIRRVDEATRERLQEQVIQAVGERSPVMMPPEDEFHDDDEDEDDEFSDSDE